MVVGSNINQVRTWIKDAQPEDLLTIATLVLNRVGTLEPRDQARFFQQVQHDPQANRVFEKMQMPIQ